MICCKQHYHNHGHNTKQHIQLSQWALKSIGDHVIKTHPKKVTTQNHLKQKKRKMVKIGKRGSIVEKQITNLKN